MERNNHPMPGWNDNSKLMISYGIAAAMAYLHSQRIIHRDLKPANILLNEFLIPKIADFGFSKANNNKNSISLFQTFTNETKGTPNYMSPEIWEQNIYSEFSDVYAYGLILYEIYTGERLFEKCHYFNISLMVSSGYRPPFNKPIPSAYKDLIRRCWRQIPYAKPTFNNILTEFKTNTKFITDKINKEEFYKCIDMYQSTYSESKNNKIHRLFHRSKDEKLHNFKKQIQYSLKLFPFRKFILLKKDESIQLVKDAETDPMIQFIVGKCLIEGENDFPLDVQLGLEYLKQSIKNGNIESLVFYIKMLIKGEVIPQNHKKSLKLIETKLKTTKSLYLLLKGKLFKKEKI